MRIALMGLAIAGSMSLGACASTYDRYGYDDRYGDRNNSQLGRAAAGAALGAAAGAGVAAVVDGVSTAQGVAVGGLVGATVGAVSGNNQRWYPDNRGDCYYVNSRGERIYDYGRRC